MSNEILIKKQLSVADYAHNEQFKKKIEETLGDKTPQFISSVLSLVNTNNNFKKCKPTDIFTTCMMAASLDLPINKDLGQAWIIPYGNNPQLQIGWKGFIQLAQRTGLFITINATDVREGEIKNQNRLSGEIEFNWIQKDEEREKAKIIGYVSYFKLTNGFEKTLYMTIEQLNSHGKKYSKSYNRDDSIWKTDFNSMAIKTVIKLLLNRYAPLSIDSQLKKALVADQQDSCENYIDNNDKVMIVEAKEGESQEDRVEEQQDKEVIPTDEELNSVNELLNDIK